ncbi:MAG TPA: IS1595 family transposase [Candidatus Marinimicrobia bacterium]|nr:IS1595 family transposase [Candidatus Neomarinimicrobiota bacterium]
MDGYPTTMLEFEEWFSSEADCRAYLYEIRWPDGFVCPQCSHGKGWESNRELYVCASCGHQVSLTSGTVFHRTRKPLMLWFRAMWHVTNQKHGVSALGLQRALGLGSYRTAWTWLHKLRHAMVRPGRDRLHGVVEVDETYIGGARSGKRGRGAEGKTLVMIAVEDKGTGIGRIRLQQIEDASGQSLTDAIKATIEPGSNIRTDGWRGYNSLKQHGYSHEIAGRGDCIVGENLLPLAHRIASLLKRWLTGTHQGAVQPSHLDYYLDEYTFRFNRRTSRSRGKLFYRLVQQALMVDPVEGKEIRGGKKSMT